MVFFVVFIVVIYIRRRRFLRPDVIVPRKRECLSGTIIGYIIGRCGAEIRGKRCADGIAKGCNIHFGMGRMF